ncbi:LTA synthase family protein [Flavimarina sp. Hel_I_48]|uniref:LTA synthase family protein n=1 Tax=Flavimarina sp. Hel_I_48 TaxID=1392488 RepID=UPI000E3E437F|nr:LTA synthase family protein [Flavimarina sp. Hel_I_48]
MKTRLFESLEKYFVLALIVLVFLFLARAGELMLYNSNHALPADFFSLLVSGWATDFVLWLQWLLIPLLIFVPFFIITPRITVVVFGFLIVVFFAVHLLLISYFNTSLVLLGSDLLGYSLDDIKQTVGASGSLSFGSVLLYISVLLLLSASLYFCSTKYRVHKYFSISFIFLSLLLIIPQVSNSVTFSEGASDFGNSIVVNKSAHFYGEVEHYFSKTAYEVDIYAANYLRSYGEDHLTRSIEKEYTFTDFPFLHKRKKDDVLTPFFKPNEKAPHLVFILVEGLGRAFTNEGAYLGNFTPFLDSLSQKSLYWKNFISSGGRTFAVLPSIMGSLPFAEKGFLELKQSMPKELSLINLLSKNAYETSFFYGGNSEFDGMDTYLKKNGIDGIYDEPTFPPTYKKLPGSANFSWGYGDRELFDYYLKKKKDKTLSRPRLDILLTLTTHSPFKINDAEKYEDLFEKRMNLLNFSTEEKENHRVYKNQFATILYTDEAIKELFETYKKRSDFNNTIFIITGDHRIPEIPMSSKIDRYHVPLMIYSPMLTRTASIASVSSHFDIAPSLLNYLAYNHQFKIPVETSFLGSGLDTVRSFRNIHEMPLKQTKTDLVDYVKGIYHLNKDNLFELNRDLGEFKIENENKKAELQAAFRAFKRRNLEITNGAPLIPDSIYNNYILKR